jgi:hypothetical protein
MVLRGKTPSLAGEGVGGSNADEGTDTLARYVYFNPSIRLNLSDNTPNSAENVVET